MEEFSSIRKQIIFSPDLVERINSMRKILKVDFSRFVRDAAEERIERIERERLDAELAEGYAANAELDQITCDDFKHIDGENI
ncbi:MAG: hypothetical protein KJ908_05830 [Acidobacteria bacterium]|nr:hypothetical protein [Acidobacteriota bacterium]MBU4203909.1 hypothetical protein [Acidobacteriota bacterium]